MDDAPQKEAPPTQQVGGTFVLGHVIAVSGAKLTGTLVNPGVSYHRAAGGSFVIPAGIEAQIGMMVKIPTRRSIAYGLVSAIKIPMPSSPPTPRDLSLIEVDLFGEAFGSEDEGETLFERGVSVYPALGYPIVAAERDDLVQIYARPTKTNVAIGTLHQDPTIQAYLSIDDLLGKHFAILGTTGSGKSCAIALILRAILGELGCGHIVLLDPHQEYAQAFGDLAHVLTPENLHLPYWLMDFEETAAVLCREDGDGDGERAILKQALLEARQEFLGDDAEETLTVDTPSPYRLSTLIKIIKDGLGQLDRPEGSMPYLRLLSTLESLRRDERYSFMFGGLSARDTMSEVLSSILRLPTDGKPITIFSLAGVPSEIVDVLVSLLARLMFDFALWSDRSTAAPLLLVCEESHRYIPRDTGRGFAPTRRALARIAKEGRKYGVSLGLVTQRPSELSDSVLTQCNTLFALRMSNENDQVYVRGALPESAAGLLGGLPALRTQEAVVVGEGVTFPMRIRFDELDESHRPKSATARFSHAWKSETDRGLDLAQTIQRWRRQAR